MFLNATPNRPPCRDLVVRLLSTLWKILALFREQRRYRFYSSSLLIAYDAKRLRHHMRRQLNNSFAESLLRIPVSRSKTFSGAARSLNSLNQVGTCPSPVSSPSKLSVFSFPRPGSPKQPVTGFSTPGAGSPKLDTPPRAGSPRFDTPPRSPRINRTIDRIKGLKRSISLQNCQVLSEKPGADFGKDRYMILHFKEVFFCSFLTPSSSKIVYIPWPVYKKTSVYMFINLSFALPRQDMWSEKISYFIGLGM